MAAAEIADAAAWYGLRSSRAADGFLDELDFAFSRVCENPDRWPIHSDGFRHHLLHKYPYQIVYHVNDSEVLVYAIAHGNRRQNYWKKRQENPEDFL